VSVSGRVAIVSGATGGLGRVAVERMAAAGASLALLGTDESRLAALASELGLNPDRTHAGVVDLRDADAVRAAVDAVADRFGRIEILFHVVGGYSGGTPLVDLDPAEIGQMLDQHLWTTVHLARAVVPHMTAAGWGRIGVVSASTAAAPVAKMAPYVVGKAAQETLILALARELAGTGVTANVLVVKKIDLEREREREPSPKNASWTLPEEIIAAFEYLCTDEARVVNGARIPLLGG